MASGFPRRLRRVLKHACPRRKFPRRLKPALKVALTARLKPRPFKATVFSPCSEAALKWRAVVAGLKSRPFKTLASDLLEGRWFFSALER
jgi:hypothetical protein